MLSKDLRIIHKESHLIYMQNNNNQKVEVALDSTSILSTKLSHRKISESCRVQMLLAQIQGNMLFKIKRELSTIVGNGPQMPRYSYTFPP